MQGATAPFSPGPVVGHLLTGSRQRCWRSQTGPSPTRTEIFPHRRVVSSPRRRPQPRNPLTSGHHLIQHPTWAANSRPPPPWRATISRAETPRPRRCSGTTDESTSAQPIPKPATSPLWSPRTRHRTARALAADGSLRSTSWQNTDVCQRILSSRCRSLHRTDNGPRSTPARRAIISNHSPRLLHKTEGVTPGTETETMPDTFAGADRQRRGVPIGVERAECFSGGVGPPNLSDLDQGHKIRGLFDERRHLRSHNALPPGGATLGSHPTAAYSDAYSPAYSGP